MARRLTSRHADPSGSFSADRFGRCLTGVVGAAVERIDILVFALASDFAILLLAGGAYLLWLRVDRATVGEPDQ